MLKTRVAIYINGVNYRSTMGEFRFKVFIIILPAFLSPKASTVGHGAERATHLGEICCGSEGSSFYIHSYLGMLL